MTNQFVGNHVIQQDAPIGQNPSQKKLKEAPQALPDSIAGTKITIGADI
jgi:hypothetical protein